ncbi:MAG: putative adenine-specific methylase [Bacteroidales bacterium]
MAVKNTNLHAARQAKNDEFYTQLPDIENELRHYRDHFRGKAVLCNCDDPRISNFFYYFAYNFEKLGLKRLITTCYKNQNPDLFSAHQSETAIYLIYDGDKNDNRVPDPAEIGIKPLKGDGDFRSPEGIELLKQSDIVVTNPPFSLFREYVAQLIEYEKKFLIIGNDNCRTYKEIFPLIKNNKFWCGYNHVKEFSKSDGTTQSFGNVSWYTNLEIKKRHEDLILYKTYTPEEYPKYDNYDAIEVSKTADIPMDYDGVMGVPITFLDKYNPEQFDLIGMAEDNGKGFSGTNNGYPIWDGKNPHCVIHGENKFKRLFIKRIK